MLAASGLCKSYGGQLVFRDVNLCIGRGSTLVVTGRNGAGKTSLLNVLGGHVAPDAGVIRVDGQVVNARLLREISRFGPGRESSWNLRLTGRDNLTFSSAIHGVRPVDARARIHAAADALGLPSMLDEPVADLSAGYRALLGLARASLSCPRLLLLDEPFAHLDAGAEASVIDWLDRLRHSGVATAIAVHHRHVRLLPGPPVLKL